MITRAVVNIWGNRVGAVEWIDSAGIAVFRFDPAFLTSGLDLAPFMMPKREAATSVFRFPELRRSTTFKGLPGMLADVLPDKYGTALINSWLTRNGRPADSINPIERLCFIADRGMGALEFEPQTYPASKAANPVEISELQQVSDQILAGKKQLTGNLEGQDEHQLMEILKVGTSAGGARAKAIIAYNETTAEIRTGQADAPAGFEHWLIKFDGIQDEQLGASNGYGRVEMAYYLMAKAAGIHMQESRLLEENGRAHFMTKRFDRTGPNQKLHMQSFCALKHFDFNEVGYYGYEQLFDAMRGLNLPYDQHEQLYRRMVFNVLARNCDDHTKNFSFLLTEAGAWSLSPAYDLCHAYRPNSNWVSRQSLTVNGKTSEISKVDLLAVAKNADIKKAAALIDQVGEVIGDWYKFAAQAQVSDFLAEAIEKTLLPGFEQYKPIKENNHGKSKSTRV